MSSNQILIVEDEAIIASDIRYMVEKLGYEVSAICDTGEEAIAQADRLKPDLILMDIRLEDAEIDGIGAAETIRKENDIPVVFLTSHTDQATLNRAKVTGPHGYVVKPIELTDLYATVEVALHKAELDRELAERERWLANVMTSVADGLIVSDADGRIKRWNPEAARIVAIEADVLNSPLDEVFRLADSKGNTLFASPLVDVLQSEVSRETSDDVHLRTQTGHLVPIEYTASALRDDTGRFTGLVLAFRDVTEKRKTQAEREQLIKDLQEALENVKTLTGMLPICSYCKDVRKDDGYWERVEQYVERYSKAKFSHGICPSCVRKHFPDMADQVLAGYEQNEGKAGKGPDCSDSE